MLALPSRRRRSADLASSRAGFVTTPGRGLDRADLCTARKFKARFPGRVRRNPARGPHRSEQRRVVIAGARVGLGLASLGSGFESPRSHDSLVSFVRRGFSARTCTDGSLWCRARGLGRRRAPIATSVTVLDRGGEPLPGTTFASSSRSVASRAVLEPPRAARKRTNPVRRTTVRYTAQRGAQASACLCLVAASMQRRTESDHGVVSQLDSTVSGTVDSMRSIASRIPSR